MLFSKIDKIDHCKLLLVKWSLTKLRQQTKTNFFRKMSTTRDDNFTTTCQRHVQPGNGRLDDQLSLFNHIKQTHASNIRWAWRIYTKGRDRAGKNENRKFWKLCEFRWFMADSFLETWEKGRRGMDRWIDFVSDNFCSLDAHKNITTWQTTITTLNNDNRPPR